jgi:hypothetical protein
MTGSRFAFWFSVLHDDSGNRFTYALSQEKKRWIENKRNEDTAAAAAAAASPAPVAYPPAPAAAAGSPEPIETA